MKKKSESVILGDILREIVPGINARVLIEPEWGLAGQITFKSGRKSYFKYNTLDLNPVGSSDIAKDKDFSNFFMENLGYPVVPGSKTFFSKQWAQAIGAKKRTIDYAYAYAQKIGFPVVVKPNSGSQGSGVAFVCTRRDFYRAMNVIFKLDRVALVQKPVQGKDYRIVVLDDEVISAYERIPLNVLGDGKKTIEQLLKNKQLQFIREKRDTQINFTDPRFIAKLARQKISLASIPSHMERVFLLDNANLSTGGDSIDVTSSVHKDFVKIAVDLTRDMGLRLCGVDLMIDGDISDAPATYWILEINAAPGLDHYAKSGKRQKEIVESLYLKVIKSIDR